MKKLLVVALSLILFFSFAPQSEAKTKYLKINKTFINTLKDGRLPNTKGKIGMKYGSLKKVTKGKVRYSESYNFHGTNLALYGFLYDEKNYQLGKIRNNERLDLIGKTYNSKISKKDLSKYLKKAKIRGGYESSFSNLPYYKAGKYYLDVDPDGKTLYLHTKASIKKWLGHYYQLID